MEDLAHCQGQTRQWDFEHFIQQSFLHFYLVLFLHIYELDNSVIQSLRTSRFPSRPQELRNQVHVVLIISRKQIWFFPPNESTGPPNHFLVVS